MLLRMFSEDPLHPNPLGCWIRPVGLEPRTLHSDPSPGDSDPQQSYRSTCNGGGRGMEKSCPKGWEASGEEGGPRSEECADQELTLLGAGVRHSAHGKGHEEGGLTYAKAGSSLRSPPGNPRASTPITRACLLYYFVLSPTPLALRGAVPHHLFRRRS